MKAAELRQMSDEQLRLTIEETEKSLFKLRMQASTERLDVPSELRRQRRLIARVKTIQSQRQIATVAK
ncbi:50S ribosomal protein L29 [Anatilimnocola aggregata]|uniref:Large ribosomal subunit protein uL29 n=1 Tax=Anatilimnocola aggregata TaxID=2528021 RepID=A0A517YJR7_9BACT|nr:50S ribosomal protein L29 [Anatilimnocola aggregata]QDU30468.1 50S ribosomal protein L29 [Anatilimnocola aggregata]